MRSHLLIAMVLLGIALGGCKEDQAKAPPPPQEITASAIGHFCGMGLLEHVGPKGQVILASRADPIWFTSARDVFAFTMLPEEAKDIRAVYVSYMAKAPGWDEPGATNWVEARKAFFVIGSRMKGGMGADETVPFAERAAAERFAGEHGGQVVTFAEVPDVHNWTAWRDALDPQLTALLQKVFN